MSQMQLPEGVSVRRFDSVPYVRYWYEADENLDLMADIAELNDKGIAYRLDDTLTGVTRLYVPAVNVASDGAWLPVKH